MVNLRIALLVRKSESKKNNDTYTVQANVSCTGSDGTRSRCSLKVECDKSNLLKSTLNGVVSYKLTEKGTVIGPGAKEINDSIRTETTKISNIFDELRQANNQAITAKMITYIYSGRQAQEEEAEAKKALKKKQGVAIVAVLTEMVDRKLEMKKIQNPTHDKSIRQIEKIKLFFQHIKNEDLTYHEFNYTLYKQLIEFVRTTKFANHKIKELNCPPKGNLNLKQYVQLIEAGNRYASRDDDSTPIITKFDTFKYDGKTTDFLTVEELKMFEDFDIPKYIDGKENYLTPKKQAEWARVIDLFVFMANTGLSTADVRNFTKEKIMVEPDGDEWIISVRQKTGEPNFIKIVAATKAILEKYNYELPAEKKYPQKQNDILAKITTSLKLTKKVTTKVARKTAGMIWLNSPNISLETTSKMLGHARVDTTQKYYASVGLTKIKWETRDLK